jgi:lipoate-protein ligase A
MDRLPALRSIGESYRLILGAIVEALTLPGLAIFGLSDIVLGTRKVSGNAQRRGRRALLHHGTLLYDFDVRCLERYLAEPERQPAYRCGRSHADFVANLGADPHTIRQAITLAWTRIQDVTNFPDAS